MPELDITLVDEEAREQGALDAAPLLPLEKLRARAAIRNRYDDELEANRRPEHTRA